MPGVGGEGWRAGVYTPALCAPPAAAHPLGHHRSCRKNTDLETRLDCKLDLDYGNEDWMYTAHFFPRDSVPFDIVAPIKNK